MIDLFSAIYFSPYWVFVGLGCLLLISELVGAGGYGLWSGSSSLAVAFIAWLFSFSWPILWLLFSVFTLVSAYLWWLWINKKNQQHPPKIILNQPKTELIGLTTIVTDAIVNGSGRVKIKDGSWSAKCHEDLPVGTKVKVTDVDGIILTINKIHRQDEI